MAHVLNIIVGVPVKGEPLGRYGFLSSHWAFFKLIVQETLALCTPVTAQAGFGQRWLINSTKLEAKEIMFIYNYCCPSK